MTDDTDDYAKKLAIARDACFKRDVFLAMLPVLHAAATPGTSPQDTIKRALDYADKARDRWLGLVNK